MHVSVQRRTPRRRPFGLRLPPALVGAAAVFLIALVALGQPAPGPADGPGPVGARPPATAPAAAQANPAAPGADAGAAAPADEGPQVRIDVQTLWDLFKKGGPVMWVLAASSVLALALIFERLFALRRGRVIPRGFLKGLKTVWRDPRADRERALQYCDLHDSPTARMVAAFIKRLPRGFEQAEKALEDAGGNEALKLRQNMRMLYAIGSVATLLGLIGTIAGMIKAFMKTANPSAEGADRVRLLSEGIYEAMVCTFGGLAVAILVTIFYYYFVGRIERLIGDINDELTRFSDNFGLSPESEAELGVTAGLERLR